LDAEGLHMSRAQEPVVSDAGMAVIEGRAEDHTGHRYTRDGQHRTRLSVASGGLVTRKANQPPPRFPCEWFAGDGRAIVHARDITADQVRTLWVEVCRANRLPAAGETMRNPGRGRPDQFEDLRQRVRARIAYETRQAGVPAKTIAAALGIGPAAASRLIQRGAQVDQDVEAPGETPLFVFRPRK